MQLITNYKNIVLVGDFNARTAEEKDYIFFEDYEFGDDLQGISINEVCNLRHI
jgi:endonuclease/exonuclease/phosphatase family metal-dependent hydrolase